MKRGTVSADTAIWLILISHDAKAHEQVIAASDHSWDDGVVRPLAALDIVRVSLNQREVGSAVLQREATSCGNGTGSKA